MVDRTLPARCSLPTPGGEMNTSRRRFLKTAAGAAIVAPAATRAANLNGRGQHACIGVGGMGWNDFNKFKSHGKTEVVAICDVDSKRLARASREGGI